MVNDETLKSFYVIKILFYFVLLHENEEILLQLGYFQKI